MTETPAFTHAYRTAALPQRKPTRFDLRPDDAAREAIAAELGLIAVTSLSLRGEIRPVGKSDFLLDADLAADVTQPCVATLAPVPAAIREHVVRRYVADWREPTEEESEMPQDESFEPLGEQIDAGAALVEALALALPLYPRAPGAEFHELSVSPPGAEPLSPERTKPFAGLAALMKKDPDAS